MGTFAKYGGDEKCVGIADDEGEIMIVDEVRV